MNEPPYVMRQPQPVRHWSDIAPKDAVDMVLPRADVIGPVNEAGQPCQWPWDPQQLKGAPLGQYHCPYCNGMQVAGMPHLDWSHPCETCGKPSWQCQNDHEETS